LTEEQVKRGEVDVIELYKATGDLFKLEQARAERLRAHR
jgi:hypothetical protein